MFLLYSSVAVLVLMPWSVVGFDFNVRRTCTFNFPWVESKLLGLLDLPFTISALKLLDLRLVDNSSHSPFHSRRVTELVDCLSGKH